MDFVKYLVTALDFNTVLLLLMVGLFGIVFWRESKNPNSKLNWADMLLDSKTEKTSLTKVSQMWGVMLSSWIAIFFAQKIPVDKIADMYSYIFGIWLAFMIGSYSMSSILKTKDGTTTEIKKEGEQ